MSGFSDDWLNARAVWDEAARNHTVEAALRAWAGGHAGRLQVVDLGAGNGNNQRHLAPLFAQPVDWLLVDNDPVLLAAAERNAVLKDGDRLACRVEDLAHADLSKLITGADLVAASALFDLVSGAWLVRLLNALAERRAAFLSVLTYDGRLEIGTGRAETETVRRLFNRHQQSDKGFGPALGPEAVASLSSGLRERSYNLTEGASDWTLSAGDSGAAELVGGWLSAASEMAPENAMDIASWGAELLQDPDHRIRVGHCDQFAVPPVS